MASQDPPTPPGEEPTPARPRLRAVESPPATGRAAKERKAARAPVPDTGSRGPRPPGPPVAATARPIPDRAGRGKGVALFLFAVTMVQTALAGMAPALPQFAGKSYGVRFLVYPVAMIGPPMVWWLVRRAKGWTAAMPWGGFALLMLPFFLYASSDAVHLFDNVSWWDDAMTLINWFVLSLGLAVLYVRTRIRWPWLFGLVVTATGIMLAVVWEIGEWLLLLREGREAEGHYLDVLGDQALAALGATAAGLLAWDWLAKKLRDNAPPHRGSLRAVR